MISLSLSLCVATAAIAQKVPEPPKFGVPDINKRATRLVKPSVSDALLFGELDGTIVVKTVVDASGNVESATAPLGFSEEARAAAEFAARESKFEPLIVKGKAERYTGTLQYSFAYDKMDWWAFGTMLESVHNFDNISVAPVAEKLTVRWAEEKVKLAEIDTYRDVNQRIKALAWTIGHFRSKLTGRDQWLFSTAVAVRNVTFWPMAAERIERDALQSALANLASFTKNAPPEIPQEFIDILTQMAEYKVDMAMDERKLRQELVKLSVGLRNYPR